MGNAARLAKGMGIHCRADHDFFATDGLHQFTLTGSSDATYYQRCAYRDIGAACKAAHMFHKNVGAV